MGRRIVSWLACALAVGVLAGCGHEAPEPLAEPVKTYPTSFSVPDAAFDAESTAEELEDPPNVDLTSIAAEVGYDGIRAHFTYAKDWNPDSSSRWGIRFEIRGSDGSRLSGAWTQDPTSTALTRQVQLAPRPAGCSGTVSFATAARVLTLSLTPGCLPGASPTESRRWIRFDTIESVSSWHSGPKILYAWDQLYARVVAPEPERLYLPD
ncbi:hypothetical protein [Nocardioides marmorisolisilvae]|uniref:Lipoprotein n=1 Tax=Nocardioides marmorisolisilvae TaxID=1542737 RepID=A0A3N0DS25_9ACTN|nr:hypothetical protein [Nocardioides marmorisolisilvae]RNL78438.1 hypothetical protein EFL95_04895 [Nocardioides marmorisolisilvae]